MAKLNLPLIDLSSSDRVATSKLIRQACLDNGFFYVVNHGIEEGTMGMLFDNTKKFFGLPLEEKMKIEHSLNKNGYTKLFSETLDPSHRGDFKEGYYLGPKKDDKVQYNEDQWPSEEILPGWREEMESYYQNAMKFGTKLLSLVALALNLDEDFFEKVGALRAPMTYLRIMHYPAHDGTTDGEVIGQSAHSDYGMITLLLTDGVPGLQICRDKDNKPQVWEDVPHIEGAFVVNVGDMLERWTNCMFRSTLHRVISVGLERYSIAFFILPSGDCLVECLESCCSETNPPKFPTILSGDYLVESMKKSYGDKY